MCFIRSKIFTFSKMSLASILKKKAKQIEEEQIQKEERRQSHSCAVRIQVLKEKAFFIDKSKHGG